VPWGPTGISPDDDPPLEAREDAPPRMTAPAPKFSLMAAPALLGNLRWPANRDRRFWVGLACATLVHLLILVGMLVDTGQGRRMGEPDASPDGVSVVIVDAADIKSRTNVPSEMPASPPPQPQAQPQTQPRPPTPPTPPQPEQEEQQEAQQTPQANKPSPQQPPPLDPDAPGEAQPQPQQQPQPKPQPKAQRQAAARPPNPAPSSPPSLNLNLSPSPAFNNRGGSFAPTRPPGITRSGENDEFGRGVIRALQRTVPQLVNTVGRVTVRILLNTKGNLANVEVIRPSGVGNIDLSVVFAVKQASFPIPPDNSTEADRTFFVTYIFTVY
jgi:protein TonB